MKLSYNGTAYSGWQRQDNAVSVQQTIEKALRLITGIDIEIVGCGRTDTGVHASFYVAHFDTEQPLDVELVYKLNSILPKDIAVHHCKETADTFHARFSAISREYCYFIHCRKDPFLNDRSWFVHQSLDIDAMNRACTVLMDYDDFASFCKKGADNKTTICKLTHAEWVKEDHRLIFTIRADRFLRNMVRAIVGTMIDVGLGKTDMHNLRLIIEARDRGCSGASVPACGLYLTDVQY